MNQQNDVQFLSGRQAVLQALLHRRRPLYRLLLSRKSETGDLVRLAREAGIEVRKTDTGEVGRRAGTSKHQGVLLECGPLPVFPFEELLKYHSADNRDLLVLLAGVEDPRNLGAVARSCSFLGVRAMLVPARGTAPLSPTASRVSAGALESLPVALTAGPSSACRALRAAGYDVAGVERGGEPMSGWRPGGGKTALVLGGEDRGLPAGVRSECSRIVTIDGEGPTGSLNLSVAAGIAIHHVITHQEKKMGNGI